MRLIAVATLILGSPLLGLVIAGIPGVVVGLILGVVGYVIGDKATVRIHEIERGHT